MKKRELVIKGECILKSCRILLIGLIMSGLPSHMAFGDWNGACSETAAKEKTDKVIDALVEKDFEAFKQSYYGSANVGVAKFTYDGLQKMYFENVSNASFVEISTDRYPGQLCVIYGLQEIDKKIEFIFKPDNDPPCKIVQWTGYSA